MDRQRVVAIVVAAGSGKRLGADAPKALVEIDGVPIVARAARAAAEVAGAIVVAAPAGSEDEVRSATVEVPGVRVVAGGSSRQASVRAALGAAPEEVDVVVVHDAARPFATPALFAAVIEAVAEGGDGAIPLVDIPDTVKRVREGAVVATEDRTELGLAQTPQAFRAGPFRAAHERAAAAGADLTDDAALMEWAGHRVVTLPGEPGNFKITTAADLERAAVRG